MIVGNLQGLGNNNSLSFFRSYWISDCCTVLVHGRKVGTGSTEKQNDRTQATLLPACATKSIEQSELILTQLLSTQRSSRCHVCDFLLRSRHLPHLPTLQRKAYCARPQRFIATPVEVSVLYRTKRTETPWPQIIARAITKCIGLRLAQTHANRKFTFLGSWNYCFLPSDVGLKIYLYIYRVFRRKLNKRVLHNSWEILSVE